MTQMHGASWFAGVIWCKWYTPTVWVCRTTEIEHPFRMSKHTVMIRFWWNQCLVLGKWRETETEWWENILMAVKKRKRLWDGEKVQAAKNFGNNYEMEYTSIQDIISESSEVKHS
jgi:hypothetical protein